jgi:hypothetical protein
VLRAAGETETTQQSIQDWLKLDEEDPGFQLLTEEEIASVIFFCLFSSALPISLYFPFFIFKSFPSFRAVFYQINSDDLSPQLIQIRECLLYLAITDVVAVPNIQVIFGRFNIM